MTSDYVGDDRQFVVSIGDLSIGTSMHESFNRPLSTQLVERLRRYGHCTACGRPAPDRLDACQCGHIPRQGGALEVTISDRSAEPRFDKLVAQLLDRAKSATRRVRLAANPPTLTEAEVAMLLTWQRSMCFYCGSPFQVETGETIFRRDHVLALLRGGATSIENTVLACVSCNARKGSGDAMLFVRRMARARAPEAKRAYAAMRRSFRRHLASYLARRDV
jgi:5-methylcytosine-specific restriction endonuclease McrA